MAISVSMEKGAADSFVYAKMSGILAKSFTGSRAEKLFLPQTVNQLWALLFDKEAPSVPQVMLAKALESEAEKNFIQSYISLISNYENPSELSKSFLSFYEYENLKSVAASLCKKEEKIPSLIDISGFKQIHYEKWPLIEEMTEGTVFEWYNKVPSADEQSEMDYKLDTQYLRNLWASIKKSSPSCRKALEDLIGEKIRIDNVVWALRLRIYYKMPDFEIMNHLIYSTDEAKAEQDKTDVFVSEAAKILEWDSEDYDKWKTWHFSKLLNPDVEEGFWSVDPRWIFNAYKSRYVKKAIKLFHQFPFTDAPLVCFFIIKRNEVDNIRMAAESLRLNISSVQARQLAGVQEV